MTSGTETLSARVLTWLDTVLQRPDVCLKSANYRMEPVGRWQELLPTDMFEFYSALNGLSVWLEFTDEDYPHGPALHALYDDGRTIIDSSTGREISRAMPASQFVHGIDEETQAAWADDQIVLISGAEGEGGLFLKVSPTGEERHRFYVFDSDRGLYDAGSSFAELLERAMLAGFHQDWRKTLAPESSPMFARLSESPRRESFRIAVEDLSEATASAFRTQVGTELNSFQFDTVMAAIGRPERFDSLDAQQRGELFDAVTRDPKVIDAKGAKAVLERTGRAFGMARGDKPNKTNFKRFLRTSGEPVLRVGFRIEDLKPWGAIDPFSATDVLERALRANPEIEIDQGGVIALDFAAFEDGPTATVAGWLEPSKVRGLSTDLSFTTSVAGKTARECLTLA